MDVHDQLNQLAAMVRSAKTMPMSTSCLVNRAEMLAVIERLRDGLPANLEHADALLAVRDAVVAAGHQEAARLLEGAREEREQLTQEAASLLEVARVEREQMIEEADRFLESARAEREQLIEQTDVLVGARAHALTVTTQAQAEASKLLAEADQYVDRRLAEFEMLLGQLQSQAGNGRERLAARREADPARRQGVAQGALQDALHESPTQENGRSQTLPELPAMSGAGPVDH